MITIKEISNKNNIALHLLYSRLKKYGIVPIKKIAHTKYYTKENAEQLTVKRKRFYPTQDTKLKVIEYYLMFNRQPKKVTADELGISYSYFKDIIGEWRRNDNCITIQSKLN